MTESRVYDADQVDSYVADLQAHVGSLNTEIAALRAQVADSSSPAMDDAAQRALGRALLRAQWAADQAAEEARQEGDRILEAARQERNDLLDEARRKCERLIESARQERDDLIDRAQQESAEIVSAAHEQSREMVEAARRGAGTGHPVEHAPPVPSAGSPDDRWLTPTRTPPPEPGSNGQMPTFTISWAPGDESLMPPPPRNPRPVQTAPTGSENATIGTPAQPVRTPTWKTSPPTGAPRVPMDEAGHDQLDSERHAPPPWPRPKPSGR